MAAMEYLYREDTRMLHKLLTVGRCIDDALKESTEEWFRQHGGYRDREEAFANGLTSISASVELRQGGAVVVHVVLTARLKSQNLTGYQKYQREPGKGYVRVLVPLK
jgi:hypothetical protein